MITLQITSDSSVPELHIARRVITEMIELRGDATLGVANVDKRWTTAVQHTETLKVPERVAQLKEHLHNDLINGAGVDPTFNATELQEAETMGKPVCSTVVADQSTTAPVDIQANTSLPEPTSVFGQAAQTTANVASPAVHLTPDPVVDVDGLLWDKRIHSSSKELNKDGTWRKRRGVADALVAQVEAELRGEHSVPIPQAKFVEQPSTLQPVTHVDVTPPPVITETSPHHDVQVTVSSGDMSFTELLDGVTKAMVAGQLSQATIAEALKSVGLEALPHLLGNPALIPTFRQALGGVV